jgi:hypothetical protein
VTSESAGTGGRRHAEAKSTSTDKAVAIAEIAAQVSRMRGTYRTATRETPAPGSRIDWRPPFARETGRSGPSSMRAIQPG